MLRLLVVTEDVPAMYLYNITDGARYLYSNIISFTSGYRGCTRYVLIQYYRWS